MNYLVPLLADSPWLVDALEAYRDDGREPDFTWLSNILQQGSGKVFDRFQNAFSDSPDDATRVALQRIFIPVVKEGNWSESLYNASLRPPVESPEWVTMLGGEGTGLGLTLPDDDTTNEKLSFFTSAEGYRVVDIALTGPPSVIANSQANHCSLPTRASCSTPGACGSDCRPRKVLNSGERGLICLCEHGR